MKQINDHEYWRKKELVKIDEIPKEGECRVFGKLTSVVSFSNDGSDSVGVCLEGKVIGIASSTWKERLEATKFYIATEEAKRTGEQVELGLSVQSDADYKGEEKYRGLSTIWIKYFKSSLYEYTLNL